MNTTDRIFAALSEGNPFNVNGLVWRSVSSLAQYAGLSVDEVLELLMGDLAADIAIKPSKEKGLLAALKARIPAPQENVAAPVVIAGGPAFNGAPPGDVEQNPCAEVEVAGDVPKQAPEIGGLKIFAADGQQVAEGFLEPEAFVEACQAGVADPLDEKVGNAGEAAAGGVLAADPDANVAGVGLEEAMEGMDPNEPAMD